MMRSLGVRDVVMGIGLWSAAAHGGKYLPWLLARILVDGGDTTGRWPGYRPGQASALHRPGRAGAGGGDHRDRALHYRSRQPGARIAAQALLPENGEHTTHERRLAALPD